MSLSGIRVVEIGEMVAAPYAARLLADEGAEVIKVEKPTGDRARSTNGLFLGLNTNKQSVVVDLDTEPGRAQLGDLISHADIVIHDLAPSRANEVGLAPDDLMANNSQLVVCAITPYGSSGSQAEWRGEELNVVCGGGWASLSPGALTDPELPPLKPAGYVANMQAGLGAAMVTLAAFDRAEQSGSGDVIDFSMQAHVASMLETAVPLYTYSDTIQDRFATRIRNPWFILEASDGLVMVVTVEDDQWQRLVEMMGSPAWALRPEFSDFEARAANAPELRARMADWVKQHTVDDLFHDGQGRRICFAPVFSMAELERQPHLIERDFFHEVDQPDVGRVVHMGPGSRLTPSSWGLRSGAPRLGQHPTASFSHRQTKSPVPNSPEAAERPLAGVKVIDFSWVWAGPFCTLQLAYLGADVIKVESSSRTGLGRRLPIHPPDVPVTLNSCGYFNQWDQGKRSVDLDLSVPENLERIRELIRDADVVVDNFATGVMARIGLSDDELRALNPDLIIASVTGFGHEGPLRNYMGYGPTTAPLSGITLQTGYVGDVPREVGIAFGDPAAGLSAAHAIVLALVSRRRTGVTRRIDCSLWEATAVNAVDGWMTHALGGEPPPPMGNRHPTAAPQGCFRCDGDDAWVSIACIDDADWQRLAQVISPSLVGESQFATAADRKRNEDALEEVVTAWTSSRTSWDVANELQAAGVAAYPSLNISELVANDQLNERGFFVRLDHPEVGRRTHTGAPWLMQRSPTDVPRPAPLIGQHNAAVLGEVLG